MNSTRWFVVMVLLTSIAISLMIIAVNFGYERTELRYFNDLNHTNYTMKQWRIYEYDIKKLYPFEDQR